APCKALHDAHARLRNFGDLGRFLEDYDLKPATTPAEPALFARARAAIGTDPLAALWQRHREAPDDLAHRRVLAAALTAAGDPRGEFIALQLAGTTKALAAAAKLLAANVSNWLREMPWQGRDSQSFERGFLVTWVRRSSIEACVETLDNVEWATVEEFVC